MKTKVITLIAAFLSLQSIIGSNIDTDRPTRPITGIKFIPGGLFGHSRIEFHYRDQNNFSDDSVLIFYINKSRQGTYFIEPKKGALVPFGDNQPIILRKGNQEYQLTADQNEMLQRTLPSLNKYHEFDSGEFARNETPETAGRTICTIS